MHILAEICGRARCESILEGTPSQHAQAPSKLAYKYICSDVHPMRLRDGSDSSLRAYVLHVQRHQGQQHHVHCHQGGVKRFHS